MQLCPEGFEYKVRLRLQVIKMDLKTRSIRIDWIDGLRGIMTLWIIIYHYTVCFINKGFVGFGSNYSEEEALNAFTDNLPISLFTNSSFPLYVFLLLIAFIPAYKFFGDHAEESIIRQAKKRYFRLMIPTFTACVINFVFHHAGLLMHIKAGEESGIVLLTRLMNVDFSFPNLLYEGLILAYIKGSQYVTISWVMGYIFIGSYISYGIILLFGRMENKVPVYIGLFVFFFIYDQMYLCFVMGIVTADIIKSRELRDASSRNPFVSILMIVIGLICAFVPDVVLPKPLAAVTLSAVGASILIIGMSEVKTIQAFLENRLLKVINKYSFSAILIHMPIMAVISCRQYLIMANMGVSKGLIILSIFLVAIPIQILAAFLFQKLTDIIQLKIPRSST